MKLLQLTIRFDKDTFHSIYFPLTSIIALEELNENKVRLHLAHGSITPEETLTDVLDLIGEMDETLVITYKDDSNPPKDEVKIVIHDEEQTSAKN